MKRAVLLSALSIFLIALNPVTAIGDDVPKVHYAITTVSDPAIEAHSEGYHGDDHLITFNFTQQIYNPYEDDLQVTYFSEHVPDVSIEIDLVDTSREVIIYQLAMHWIINKPVSSGLTTQPGEVRGHFDGSTLPQGNYTFTPFDHTYQVDDLSYETVSHSYRISVTEDGITHHPAELPENWGQVREGLLSTSSSNSSSSEEFSLNWIWYSFLIVPVVAMSRRSHSQRF